MRKPWRVILAVFGVLLIGAGCAPQRPAEGVGQPTATPLLEEHPFGATATSATAGVEARLDQAGDATTIIVTADGPGQPIDRRLLGTNVAAWMGAERLANPVIQERVAALGPAVLRLPGGSWSNYYDWLACENGDRAVCDFPVAARPTEFLNFLRATGGEGMWTVSLNGTAREAAALVAFFNGKVDDERPIGVDVRGRDWQTVGHWARLRSANGNPEPLAIRLWEVGNEIYGAKQETGPTCAPWGWEDSWTCDGTEYVLGKGSGAERREGYLEFRTAMQAVDPDILVGAVGVARPAEWSGWGNKVITAAGESLDFYSVHLYPFDDQEVTADQVLEQPQRLWGPMIEQVHEALDRFASGRRVPVAVTEYNLFAGVDQDAYGLQRRMVNALFVADSLGQMAAHGVAMANQWNLMNGVTATDSDYGLLDPDTNEPNPPYYALVLWSRFGDELIPVSSPFAAESELSVYAGRESDGTLTLLAVNKTDRPITATLQFDGGAATLAGTLDTMQADTLESKKVRFNGVTRPLANFSDAPSTAIGPFVGQVDQTFPPFSVSLLRLGAAGQ